MQGQHPDTITLTFTNPTGTCGCMVGSVQLIYSGVGTLVWAVQNVTFCGHPSLEIDLNCIGDPAFLGCGWDLTWTGIQNCQTVNVGGRVLADVVQCSPFLLRWTNVTIVGNPPPGCCTGTITVTATVP